MMGRHSTRRRSDGQGMTLLELVVVLSLIGVVGLAFGFLYTSSQNFLIQSLDATSAQGEASFALEHIRKNLTLATAIATPAVGANGTTLTFTSTPTAGAAAVTSTYQLNNNGNLEFRGNAAGAFQVIARDIQVQDANGNPTIIFNRIAVGSVEVTLTAQHQSGADTRQQQLRTVVSSWSL